MDLFKLVATLGLDTKEFEQGVNKSRRLFGNLGNTVSAGTIAMGHLMADAVKKGADMVINLGKTGIAYNAQMEDYTSNFKVMLGSTEAAAEKVESLKAMAAQTPFEMGDLAAVTQTLLAFGVEAERTDSIMKMLGDVALGNSEKFQAFGEVFGQISSLGKMQTEDWRQLVGRGFNPLQIIAEKTGATMEDLQSVMSGDKASREFRNMVRAAQKEVKKLGENASDGAKMLAQIGKEGVISADMVTQAFEIATSEGGQFYNGMYESSLTFNGLMSTLKENIKSLIGDAFGPASEFLSTKLLPKAIEWIERISSSFDTGGLSAALGEAGSILSGIATKLIEKAPEAFGNAAQAIVDALVLSINSLFGTGIEVPFSVDETVKSAIENTFSFFKDGMQFIVDNGSTVATLVGGIGTAMSLLAIAANPIGAAVGAIGIAIAGIITNWDKFKESDIGGGIIDLVNNIASLAKDLGTANTELATLAATKFDESFVPTIQSIVDWWSGIATNIATANTNIATFIATKFDELFLEDIQSIKSWFSDIGDYISTAWTNLTSFAAVKMPQGLIDAFSKIKSVWEAISDYIGSAVDSLLEFLGLGGDGFGGGSSDGTGGGRTFAVGKDYVPYNNYAANLHRGEAVLTRSEAEEWRRGRGERPAITVIQNIYSEAKTAAELMEEARWAQERAVLGYV